MQINEYINLTLADKNIIRPPDGILGGLLYDYDAGLYADRWSRERRVFSGVLSGNALQISGLVPADLMVIQDTGAASFKEGTHFFVESFADFDWWTFIQTPETLPAGCELHAHAGVASRAPDGEVLLDSDGKPVYESGPLARASIMIERRPVADDWIPTSNIFHFVIYQGAAHIVNAMARKVELKSGDGSVEIEQDDSKWAAFDLKVPVSINSSNTALSVAKEEPNKYTLTAKEVALMSANAVLSVKKNAVNDFTLTAKEAAISSPDGTVAVSRTGVNTYTLSVMWLKVIVDKLAEDLEALSEEFDEVLAEVEDLGEEFDSLKSTVDGHASTLNSLYATVTSLQTTVNNLQTTVNNHTTTLNNLTVKINNINTTLQGLQSELDSLRAAVNGFASTLDGLEITVNSLQTTVNNLNTQVFNLENMMAQLDAYLIEMWYSYNDLNTKYIKLSERVSGHATRIAALEANAGAGGGDDIPPIGLIWQEVMTLRGQLVPALSTIGGLENTINQQNTTINSLTEQLEWVLENCCGGGEAGGGGVSFAWGTPDGGVENAHYGAWIKQRILEDFLAKCLPCDGSFIVGDDANVALMIMSSSVGGLSASPIYIEEELIMDMQNRLYSANSYNSPDSNLLTGSGFRSAWDARCAELLEKDYSYMLANFNPTWLFPQWPINC